MYEKWKVTNITNVIILNINNPDKVRFKSSLKK